MGILDRLFSKKKRPTSESLDKNTDTKVNDLIAKLEDSDPAVRYDAVSKLGEVGDVSAVEAIVVALEDMDWQVRRCATTALAKIGGEQAIEPLINALKDENTQVRGRAATELEKIGDSRAVAPLIGLLKEQDWGNRYAAAMALSEIADKRAVEPLITCLKDDKWEVRYIAASALGKLGDERAVEPLKSASKDKDELVCRAAKYALDCIGKQMAPDSGPPQKNQSSQKAEKIKTKERQVEDSMSQIPFGEATKILRFREGSETRLKNQIKYLKAAIKENKYPRLRVVWLKKSNRSASCEHLIVVSGGREQFRPIDDRTAEEIFQRVHPGKKMEDMWADGAIADTPDPGNVLTGIHAFNELRDEIKKDWYSLEEILQEVAIEEKLSSQVNCWRCGVTLLVDWEVESKYRSAIGSMDYLAERQRAINAVGVVCALCGKGFCIACMKSYGQPHAQSGGLACLECGGHLTEFRVTKRQAPQEVEATSNFQQEFDRLSAELIEIGKTDEFLTVKPNSKFDENKRNIRAREIGLRLNEMGEKKMMQQAYFKVRAALGAVPSRELEFAWNDIGEWKA